MKTLMTTTLAAVLAIGGTAAFAGNVVPAPADPYVAAPVAAPVTVNDWTGPYFGALGGWSMGDRTGVDDYDGLLYGGFAGYNYQFDNSVVIGAEVAATTGEQEWGLGGTRDATYIDLKARLGYGMDRALVYASGGYSFANYSGGDEGAGFNVGAGVDFLVTDNIFVGAEYIYRDIEDTLVDPAAWDEQLGTIQARVGITF
ncbi:MAG: porin family protein [Maritimibacter sp.]|nr:porin family protein [Maritimibacter sp.]